MPPPESEPDYASGCVSLLLAGGISLVPMVSFFGSQSAETFFQQPVYTPFEKLLVASIDIARIAIPLALVLSRHPEPLTSSLLPFMGLSALLIAVNFTALKSLKF